MMSSSEACRVLIATDRIEQRAQLQAFLETADYDVESAALDAAAIRCSKRQFDLLLLEASGPSEPLLVLLRRIRESPLAAGTAILLTYDDAATPEAHAAMLEAGADDGMPWTAPRSELLWRVRSVLRYRQEGRHGQPVELLRLQREELLNLSRQREETLSLLVHDMKNPLSGVISNAEYLGSSEGLDADQAGCAQDILQASRRLHRMVMSLLDVNQSDDGKLCPVLKPIVVRELIDETHVACSARLRDKRVAFDIRSADPALTISGDRDMLVRLLANLLDNAIVAAPSGTRVELMVSTDGVALELRFSDAGPSVPVAERAALLSEAPSARTCEGSQRPRARRGLGFRACRVLTEAHGGRIWIEDRQPHGATIAVSLPLRHGG